MTSHIMDKSCLSPSSYLYEDACIPAERQVGFWKREKMSDDCGIVTGGLFQTSGGISVAPSPLEKYKQLVAQSVDSMELPKSCLVGDQKAKYSLERLVVGAERTTNLPMNSWKTMNRDSGTRSNLHVHPASYVVDGNRVDINGAHYEYSLFSSSVSEIFNRNLRLSSNDLLFGQSVDTIVSHTKEEEPFESLEEIEAQTISNLLPNDDDLLSGVLDGLEYIAQPNNIDDIEDFDLFSSVGGMELENDGSCVVQQNIDVVGAIPSAQGISNGSIAREHPYGEHPSRTLFVRNININVEDSELRVLFEQFGDIRDLYTACKHRGFVMISYYDIRAARSAMTALQNKPLRRRKLDIHFSIPKDNPSVKDIIQGTLVVFNLDSSVSNDDLCQIFGVYGEIKEIRETPHKRDKKFIDFYDVRAAEAALRALNRSDISGKPMKLEQSHPEGARQCLIQKNSPELEQDESSPCWRKCSPPNSSTSGSFVPISHEETASSYIGNGTIQNLHSATRAPISSFTKNGVHHGISSSIPSGSPSLARVASVGNQFGVGELSNSLCQMKFGFPSIPTTYPHSFPEYHDGVANGIPLNSSGTVATMVPKISPRPSEGIDNRHLNRVGSSGHSIEHNEGVFASSGNRSYPLHGHQYLWGNSNSYRHHLPTPMMWSNSQLFVNGAHPQAQLHGFPRVPSHKLNMGSPINHHLVRSVPPVNPSLWEIQHAYAGETPEASSFHPESLGSIGFGNSSLQPLELASHNIFPRVAGNCMDLSIASANFGLHSPQQRSHMFPGRNPMVVLSSSVDAPNERVRICRNEASLNQADNKRQYELDIDRIVHGEDIRTTLMIKNIPNKYTSKMLLATIDEHHRGTYDFIYLPIDFKNKCNVGYAFINMMDPLQIVPFYQAINGKKWEKFNSEKVASLAYARIQGKAALISHFQNSSLMNEDKRCRPLIFHSNGPNAGDQEPFPMGINVRSRLGKPRTGSNEEGHQGCLSTSANGEGSSNGTDSSLGSSRES